MKTLHIFMIGALAFASCEIKCASFGKIVGAIKVLETSHAFGIRGGKVGYIAGGFFGACCGLQYAYDDSEGNFFNFAMQAPTSLIINSGILGVSCASICYVNTTVLTAASLSTLKSAHWVITKIVKR